MALTCLICGGTEFKKIDGKFVCQGCQTEYTMEEAKQMAMGPQAAPAPAPVDNSKTIENYLSMARSALDSSNNAEAETYANKVLELDTKNVEAYLIKAEAVGWQSTLGNSRLSETMTCYQTALGLTKDEEKRKEIEETAKSKINDLHHALLALRSKNFKPFPNEKDVQGLKNAFNAVTSLALQGMNGGISNFITIDISDVRWARTINNNLCDAWKKVRNDFETANERHPSKYDLQRVIERGDFIIEGFKAASLFNPKDFEKNKEAALLEKQLYDNMITLHEYLIDAKSYQVSFSGGYKHYDLDQALSASAKQYRRGVIANLKKLGNDVIEKANEAARKAYWEAHPEEEKQLNEEKEAAVKRIAELKEHLKKKTEELNAIPETAMIDEKQKLISRKIQEKNALGMFKGKEKKAISDEIDAITNEIANLKKQADTKRQGIDNKYDAATKELDKLEKRIPAIEAEFKKNR